MPGCKTIRRNWLVPLFAIKMIPRAPSIRLCSQRLGTKENSWRVLKLGSFFAMSHSSGPNTLDRFFLVKKLAFAAVRAVFPLPFRTARRTTRVCLTRRLSPVSSMLERRKDIDWNRFYRAFPA